MSEDRKRDNGCNQRGIDCNGGADRIDVCTIEPSSIRCDLIDGLPIHQLTKYCEEAGEDKKIYPVSLIQAIFDGKTGIRLDKILSMCNAIYLTYEGDFEHTVAKVQGVQRRKGLIVTYKDITNTISTIRYKSDDLSDEAWNDVDNWEGWSFDTASSDLMDMITAIFSNIEDYPDIYDAINNQIRLVLQDIFTNINNYPAVKQLIVDTTEDNIGDVLADIFAHLNNYPQVKTAFNNAFRTYINNVFGNVNNYPEVVAVIEDAVKDVFENIDDYSNLKNLIESLVNDQFYFFNITNDTSEWYSSSKTFNDYTRYSISESVYEELYDAIVAGKTIIIYANHATKASRVSTARVKNKDVYLQYFIRINETQTSDTTDNKPDVRPEFIIVNVIINAYNNSNNYVGEYIIVRYGFDSFVEYNSNKPNGIPKLNNDGKVAYEQLYPEVVGYEKEFVDQYSPNIGPTQVTVDANEYVTVYSPCMQLTITGGVSHYEEKGTRLVRGNFAGKSYVDVYLFNGATNINVTLDGLKFVPGAQAILTEGARYRFEIFEGFVDVKKIDTEAVSNVIAVVAPASVASNLPEHDDGSKFLNVTYKDMYGITKTEEFDLVYNDETLGSEYYTGLLYIYGDILGQNGIQNLNINTIFTDLPNLSVTVTKDNGVTFTKGSSATTYYYSGRVTLS